MGDAIEKLRKRYKSFKKGEADVSVVRAQVRLALEEAKNHGNNALFDELEDMLMDLEFSIEEDKCKCHKDDPTC
ncbi:MAG: hypothetical protein JSW72_07315 [Candidatus Bathyarchaeota archaeon]|nr:MAG: hypothetical protein JSW72_07315 [Candidatus Bathyarchaeota archaeon]